MKITVAFLSFLMPAAFNVVASAATPKDSLARAASSLNMQSKTSLGVSLRALTFLFDARPGTYLLKDSLVRDGSWPHLQALERAEYVKSNSITAVEGELVQIELTAKGRQVLAALDGL